MEFIRNTALLRILSMACMSVMHFRTIIYRLSVCLLLALPSTLPLAAQQDTSGTAVSAAAVSASAISAAAVGDSSDVGEEGAAAWYETTLTPAMFMSPTVVYRTTDIPISGFLREVRNDSVYLQSEGKTTPVPFTDILKLQLPRQQLASVAAVHAMFVSAYVSDVLLWPLRSRPGFFADVHGDYSGFILSNLAVAAVVGGITYVIARSTTAEEENFLFAADPGFRREEEHRFLTLVRGTHSPTRLHLTLQMSDVHPLLKDRAYSILTAAGFAAEIPSPFGGNDHKRTPVNLLRKVQLTCDILPSVAIGAAYMSLSESAEYQTGSAHAGNLEHRLVMKNALDAGFAVVTVEPLRALHTSPYSWLLGAGAGVVFSSGEANATTVDRTGATTFNISDTESLSKELFGATIFTELRTDLYRTLSIGVTAEYVYVAPLTLGPLDGINTSSSTIDFTSTSWGLVLGLHF
ncbi:MAG: hypothetical protein WBQ23_09500 [Bacteroidota bacterium]